MAGIPVRSGGADLTASGTARSAVEVQSSLRENVFLEMVVGPVVLGNLLRLMSSPFVGVQQRQSLMMLVLLPGARASNR